MLSMFHKQANAFTFLLLVALQNIMSALLAAHSSQAGSRLRYFKYLPCIIS